MDVEWVAIRSFHIVKSATRLPRAYVTVCGRFVKDADPVDSRPSGKSCETCLRWLARRADG